MWIRYYGTSDGEEFYFDEPENNNTWEAIVSYMDDEIREDIHAQCAPCSKRYFLESYIEKDPEFEQLLAMEFGIEWY